MNATANYYERNVDLVFLSGIKLLGRQTLTQQILADGGAVCTGIQKLIQRWILAFLTPRGSMTFRPERGTDFMMDMTSAYSYSDVDTAFRIANVEAVLQVKAEETEDMPDEERLESVELMKITFTDDAVNVQVKLKTKYGDTAPVILPISTNPVPV